MPHHPRHVVGVNGQRKHFAARVLVLVNGDRGCAGVNRARGGGVAATAAAVRKLQFRVVVAVVVVGNKANHNTAAAVHSSVVVVGAAAHDCEPFDS